MTKSGINYLFRRKVFEILFFGIILASTVTPNKTLSDELLNLTLSWEGKINIWANQQLIAKNSTFETTIEIQDNILIDRNRIPLDLSDTAIFKRLGPNEAKEFIFNLNLLTGALIYYMRLKHSGAENTVQITGKM